MFDFNRIHTVDQALSIFSRLEARVKAILQKQQKDLEKTRTKLKDAELRKVALEFEIRRSGDILKNVQSFTKTTNKGA